MTLTHEAISLLNKYGSAKFGDEWWPGNASAYLSEKDGARLNAILEDRVPDPAIEALLAIRTDLTALGLWHYYSEKQGQGLAGACDEIDAALRAAGLEV